MAEGQSSTGVGARIHHLAFRAGNLEATVAFYRALLGVKDVRAEEPRSVWLGLADGAVLMVEARGSTEPTVPAGSMELCAFRVSEERKREIRRIAIELGCFDGETQFTIYLRDPDGRRVGFSTF